MELNQDALIRSIEVSPAGRHMLLLGAGASASSGIPIAGQCVWEWKREIYLSGNPHVSPSLFSDITLPPVQEKVQTWLDQKGGFPPRGHTEEYGFYAEHAYPTSDSRRAWFTKRFANAVPQLGYQALAVLQNAGHFQWIWTPNFDNLCRQARSPELTRPLKEIGLDTIARLKDVHEGDDSSFIVHLHGDYRYDRLHNTTAETQSLDQELRGHLIKLARERPLLLLGYSGRDESIMRTLEDAVAGKANGSGLYVCALHDEAISTRVTNLLRQASASGYDARLVRIDGFDDFMLRLGRYLLRDGSLATRMDSLLSAVPLSRSVLRLDDYHPDDDWIKSNGCILELPREIYQFEAHGLDSWKQLRETVGNKPLACGFFKGKVLAVGDASVIAAAFDKHLRSKIERIPLREDDYNRTDTVVSGILQTALERSLAAALDLSNERGLLWDHTRGSQVAYGALRLRAYPAMAVSHRRARDTQFINFVPTVHVVNSDNTRADRASVQEVRRQQLGKQWNRVYYNLLEDWYRRLFGKEVLRRFTYPTGAHDAVTFTLRRPPAFARIWLPGKLRGDAKAAKSYEIFQAIRLEEPKLLFGPAAGHPSPKDRHPIRGLLSDGPYDFQLTQAGLSRDIRVGVVCPRGYEERLAQYMAKLLLPHPTIETKAEYLLPYPGFQRAYRVPLRTPQPGQVEWRVLPEVALRENDRLATLKLITTSVTREVDALYSSASVDVVLIFVPSAWANFEVVEDEQSRFDLHDFIKAHCVQKMVRTQLLREGTLAKAHQCEILWWLAHAIYAKALRTPYTLAEQVPGSVFVGIGYGFNRRRAEGGVVLGCSHIYDAAGQGLRYQLSRIQNPIWRHHNPYMSKDDAIRVALQARQLFYDTYQKLPERVVFHKRTHFLRSEREGLAQGLAGVREIDMLTVEEEEAWRFLAYNKLKEEVDGFPVRRGTALLLGQHEFLLWVHGNARSVDEKRSYFKGNNRIPAPLRVTRYAGHARLEQVAREILGLSKMDLNSYDLYSSLPATLESSGAIARIGQLLTRFEPYMYDYRLFM